MLDSFRKGQRWLSLIFVAVIGLVFVFFLGQGGGSGPGTPSGNAVVELDGVKLTSRDFQREKANLESRLRQELGDSYDQVGAGRFVDSQALGTLTNTLVLAAAAEEMGLHATQDEMRRVVQASPNFIDEDGRFSPEAFDRFTAYEFGSQRAFIQNFTRSLLGQKLIQLLVGQTVISDAEVDLRTRFELEETRIAYVAIDSTSLPVDYVLDEAKIETYSQEHEDEIRALFNERAEDLAEPERVRARHILILSAPDASEEDAASARERAEAVHLRLANGEDFATIAAEVSEDVGTASNGGDLGLFARGDNDTAIDDAAFALEAGDLSGVLRSSYGFHVLRVDEKIEAKLADFDLVKLDIAREGATRAEAAEIADQQSQRLAEAILAGTSLEDAAREEGLSLERPAALKRRVDGFIPGLGAAGNVLSTVFTLDEATSSPEIFALADRRVLVQVLERINPSDEVVESERAIRKPRALAEKQNRLLQIWIDDYRRQLEASGRLRVNAEFALGS